MLRSSPPREGSLEPAISSGVKVMGDRRLLGIEVVEFPVRVTEPHRSGQGLSAPSIPAGSSAVLGVDVHSQLLPQLLEGFFGRRDRLAVSDLVTQTRCVELAGD